MSLTCVPLAVIAFITTVIGAELNARPPPCSNPAIRREWHTLSLTAQTQWADAVKCHLPHEPSFDSTFRPPGAPALNTSSSWGDISYMHVMFSPQASLAVHRNYCDAHKSTQIHYTGLFLPWYRAYIYWGISATVTAWVYGFAFLGTEWSVLFAFSAVLDTELGRFDPFFFLHHGASRVVWPIVLF